MLREIAGTKQRLNEPKKRWFTSLAMDLFVWFDEEDQIISYQLSYNKQRSEKALIWSRDKGYSHLGVDESTPAGKYPGSPLLVADGALNPAALIALIQDSQGDLHPRIKDFIIDGIEDYFKKYPSDGYK